MANIDLPPGDGEETARAWSLRPAIGAAGLAYSDAVQAATQLPIDVSEAARMMIALINGCIPCTQARIADAKELGLNDAFYADIGVPANRGNYTRPQQLAIGFAERFAKGLQAFEEPFWQDLRQEFDTGQIVDLAGCCGKWLGLGRANAVLGLEVSCPIVIPRPSGSAG